MSLLPVRLTFTILTLPSCVAFHGGVQSVFLKLVHVMLRFFKTFTSQNAFALLVNLKHVKFRFLFSPAENPLEDMGDVIHEVNGVIPANDQVPGFKPAFRLFFCRRSLAWQHLWDGSFGHKRKLEEEPALVEPLGKEPDCFHLQRGRICLGCKWLGL